MTSARSASPWQPLTFGGVAAFAHGRLRRLLRAQAVVALLATGALVWILVAAFLPEAERAFPRWPDGVALKSGTLSWPGGTNLVMVEGHFLALAINPARAQGAGAVSDIEILLGPGEIRLSSMFGHWSWPYGREWTADLSRLNVEAWWRAWRPALLAGWIVGCFAGLLLSWWTLALLYAIPLRILAFYVDRELGWFSAWKLGGAAVLPGAVMISVGIVFYGLMRLNLIEFLAIWLMHLPVGWVYAAVATWRLPRRGDAKTKGNPFDTGSKSGKKRSRGNPFGGH